MEYCEGCKAAIITGIKDNRIQVRLLGDNDTMNCSGCAVEQMCKSRQKQNIDIDIECPSAVCYYNVGDKVNIVRKKGAEHRAAIVLFAIPLFVFLTAAAILSEYLEGGLAALVAVSAAGLTYALIRIIERRRDRTYWDIIDT